MSEEGGAPKTFGQSLKSLLAIDCIRLSRIAETAQYAAIYAFLALFVGIGLDTLCAKMYPVKDGNIETWPRFWGTVAVMMLQVIASAIMVFYLRKVAQLFPLFLNFCPSRYHVGYHVPERVGEIAIALVYVGAMGTLLKNMDRMRCFLTKKCDS
jgi:hypothetical protein